MTRDELLELRSIAQKRGDNELLSRIDAAIASSEQPESYGREDAGTLGDVIGAGETATSMITGMGAVPVSGLVGLGGLAAEGVSQTLQLLGLEKAAQFMDPGDLEKLVERTQQTLTYSPNTQEGQAQLQAIGELFEPLVRGMEKATQASGEVGYKLGGGSEFPGAQIGALAATIPTAILEVGALYKPKLLAKAAAPRARALQEQAMIAENAIAEMDVGDLQAAKTVIQRGSLQDIGEMVKANPTIVTAFEDMEVPYLASYVSESPIYRDIEGGLMAFKGSALKEPAEQIAKRVSEIADDMILKYDGTLDKAELTQRFRDDQLMVIDELFRQADDMYDEIATRIDKTEKVLPQNTLAHIDQAVAELGGRVPPYLREAAKVLDIKERTVIGADGLQRRSIDRGSLPTYGAVDALRKEIGQALRTKSGRDAFTSAEEGALKNLYRHLRSDMDVITEQVGGADTLAKLKQANTLVVQRKLLEDQAKILLGKDLAGSIARKTAAKMSALTKGDLLKWNEFIENVPESYRQEVVMSSLNELIRGQGLGQSSIGVNRMAKFMERLNQQPEAKKAIYKHLPEQAQKDLDNLGIIATGIARANQSVKETGVVTSLFDDQAGIMKNLLTGVTKMQIGGPIASASLIKDFLSSKTPQRVAVSQMLEDPRFRSLLTTAIEEGVVAGSRKSRQLRRMEKAIEKADWYMDWADTLQADKRAELLSLGFVNYLFQEKEGIE